MATVEYLQEQVEQLSGVVGRLTEAAEREGAIRGQHWWAHERLPPRRQESIKQRHEYLTLLWNRWVPYLPDAEQAVLGTLMVLDKPRFGEALKQLTAAMFFDPWHRGLFGWLTSTQNAAWRWQEREFVDRLTRRARDLMAEEGINTTYYLAKMINHELVDVPGLPGLIAALRKSMQQRRRIAAAEQALVEAWAAVDGDQT